MTEMERFRRDREEALRSLDGPTIRAYARRWGAELPAEDGVIFWGAVHKARTALSCFTEAERAESRRWLAAHGMQPGFQYLRNAPTDVH